MPAGSQSLEWSLPRLGSATSAGGLPARAVIESTQIVPGIEALASLFERGEDVAHVRPEAFLNAPPRILRQGGVPHAVIQEDFGGLFPEGPSLSSADWFRRLKDQFARFFRRYGLRVHRSWELTVPVRFTELHCPSGSGTLARMRQGTRSSGNRTFSLTLFGNGGGHGCSVAFEIAAGHETRDGRCVAIEMPFKVVVEECSYSRDEQQFQPFFRASPAAAENGLTVSGLDPCRRCGQPLDSLEQQGLVTHRYDLRGASRQDLTSIELKTEEETITKGVLGVDVSAVGTKVDVAGEVRTKRALHYQYELPGAARYVAYRPEDTPFYCWVTA